ncbi:MAG: DNA mismatch repair protein MutS [Flavobacteriia bacterium]|nr:DNA mismatch repair protein MutS [Flavobacteriia bacterium]
MGFKIGMPVCVLDQDLEGRIVGVSGLEYTVETTHGFLMKFGRKELIHMPEQGMRVSNYEVAQIKHLKQEKKPRKQAVVPKKERDAPKMEVDLHIHQLTQTKGLSNYEMLNIQLDTAERQLNFAIAKKIQKVVFIHGVGAGVLKEELAYLFKRYQGIRHYDADYKKYGMGATEVYLSQGAQRDL